MSIIYDGCGDVFQSEMRTITCPVNTDGVMGKGLALAFKQRDPFLYGFYRNICRDGILRVGYPFLYYRAKPRQNVLLFPTKKHWQEPSQLEWIEQGLTYMQKQLHPIWMVESLTMIPLGCGLGGLDYETQVRPLIYRVLDPPHLFVEIFHGK